MNFLIGALASTIMILLWGLFFYSRDPHKERFRDLLFTIGAGILSFFLSFIIVSPIASLFRTDLDTLDFLFYGGNILVVIALASAEEISKYIMLRTTIFKDSAIGEHADGVLIGGLLGLGFASVENFFYAFEVNVVSSLARALLIPLIHGGTGAILGFFIIEQKLRDNKKHKRNPFMALGITILFHSLYNYFIIMSQQYELALFLTMFIWIGLMLALAYVENTSRHLDFETETHSELENTDETREEGKTYCFLGFFSALIALFMIFPLFFGPIGIVLGAIGSNQGAKKWGKRTILFSVSAIIISYIMNILVYYS